MESKTKWQEFFDGHAPNYLQNCFTKNTVAEVDFLIEALGLSPGASVLDVGCGTGRHAIELARRGYRVTGLDISAGMLEQARQGAQAAGVQIRWRHEDATAFAVNEQFDGVICLCEGALGLLGQGDDAIGQPPGDLAPSGGGDGAGGQVPVYGAERIRHGSEAQQRGRSAQHLRSPEPHRTLGLPSECGGLRQ